MVEDTEALLPEGAWPIWTASNHDVSRLATRWAAGDPAKVKVALLLLLTLRGTPFLYQGDEIGLVDGPIEQEDVLDAVGARFWPVYKGRDAERTPMPWNGEPGRRVHRGGRPPLAAHGRPGAVQRGRPGGRPRLGARAVPPGHRGPPGQRGPGRRARTGRSRRPRAPGPTPGASGATVLLNMRGDTATFDDVAGTVAVSTEHGLEGRASRALRCHLGRSPPWGGAVVTR